MNRPLTIRMLIACGAIGPLLFIIVFLIEGTTRPAYSPWHDFVSSHSLSDQGWMQILNFSSVGCSYLASPSDSDASFREAMGPPGDPSCSEGLTLPAGKPKLGKSWLALSVAFAVAAGGEALGTHPVTQREVLYLASEDNERRLQSCAKQLLASMTSVPNTIAFELHWPRLDQGGLKYWEEYLEAHPHVRLVVITTWARVSSKSQHRQCTH